jgi:hypothetical protein
VDAATDTLTIPTWANGPDDSGNGGWSAGLLAEHLGAAAIAGGVSVSLRVPPPLGRPLRIVRTEQGLNLLDGPGGAEPVLVATATPTAVDLDAPDDLQDIDPDTAARARGGFPFRERHPFPRCVCCGITRLEDEPALDLHCGQLDAITTADGGPVFADRWIPTADLADSDDGAIASVAATWSALDCPSAAPIADPDATNPIVLARLAARIERQPRIGEPHVLAAWHVSSDGRKHHTRSVMLDAGGATIAAADALWIEVRPR